MRYFVFLILQFGGVWGRRNGAICNRARLKFAPPSADNSAVGCGPCTGGGVEERRMGVDRGARRRIALFERWLLPLSTRVFMRSLLALTRTMPTRRNVGARRLVCVPFPLFSTGYREGNSKIWL